MFGSRSALWREFVVMGIVIGKDRRPEEEIRMSEFAKNLFGVLGGFN